MKEEIPEMQKYYEKVISDGIAMISSKVDRNKAIKDLKKQVELGIAPNIDYLKAAKSFLETY